MALRIGDKIGPFTLNSLLGEGSFAEVWLATRDGVIPIQVAIKVLRRAYRSALETEASNWNRAMPHPNILPIIEAGEYDGYLLMVTEYAPDGSLTDQMKTHGEPDQETALRWLEGILSGLAHLHERNIVHRDLSLNNVVTQEGVARLMDFGLSRQQVESVVLTRPLGTIYCMAPEIFQGERSEEGDVWAWGVLAYRLLTGRYPFVGVSDQEIMKGILTQDLPPLPATIPAPFQPLLRKSLEKDRSARWPSAHDLYPSFQTALREWRDATLRAEVRNLKVAAQQTEKSARQREKDAEESLRRMEQERDDLQRQLAEARKGIETKQARTDRNEDKRAGSRTTTTAQRSVRPKATSKEHLPYDIAIVFLLTTALILLATLIWPASQGENNFGMTVVRGFRLVVGDGVWAFPLVLFFSGWMLAMQRGRSWDNIGGALALFFLFISWWHLGHAPASAHFATDNILHYGGYIGAGVSWVVRSAFGTVGGHIVFGMLAVISFLFLTDTPLTNLLAPIDRLVAPFFGFFGATRETAEKQESEGKHKTETVAEERPRPRLFSLKREETDAE